MSTLKRKRTLIDEDFPSAETTFSSAAAADADDDRVTYNFRDPKRLKKNSTICYTGDEIIKALSKNQQFTISPTVTSLIIKNAGMAGKDSDLKLGLALSESTNITRIELHSPSSDALRAVLKNLKTSEKLTELIIKNDKQNENDTGELRDLAALLPKLQTLWLENYVLSLDSIERIFGSLYFFAAVPPLKQLLIINAKLTQTECAVMADCFAGNKGESMKLVQLNLSHNPIKTTQAISTLVEKLQPESLNVTNCQINDDGLFPLCRTLHQRHIKHLRLGRNIIGQQGLSHLIKKINDNFSLITLDLRGIKFDPECIRILNQKFDSKTIKALLIDVAVPQAYDVTVKNRLLEGFDFANFIQAVNNDKWDTVQEILKQKPTVPLRFMMPLDTIPITKLHKLYTVAIEALTNHVANLSEKLKNDTAKKEKEKECAEFLNKRRIELESELKQVMAELKDIPNIQRSEEAIKARAKEIELNTSFLQQRKSTTESTESCIEAWKALVKCDINTWSTDEVQIFMRNIGLGTYKAILNHNKVTGSVLAHLTTTDYQQLGFTYPHTMRVLKALFVAKYFQSIDAPPGVLQWTVQEVKDWLTKNKFQTLTDTFVNNQITGSELLFLQTPDLKDWLKIDTLADRVRLEQAIAVLKNSVIEGKQQPAGKQKSKVPSHFKCPITTEIMKDPVFTSDGHTYERAAIEQWLLNHDTSPMTNEKLASKQLHSCHFLKSMIAEFLQQQQQ